MAEEDRVADFGEVKVPISEDLTLHPRHLKVYMNRSVSPFLRLGSSDEHVFLVEIVYALNDVSELTMARTLQGDGECGNSSLLFGADKCAHEFDRGGYVPLMEIFPFLGVQWMHKEYNVVVRAEIIPDNSRADYSVYYNSAFAIEGKDEYGAPLGLFYDVWEEMQGDYIADSTTLSSLFIAGAGSSPLTWYAMQLQAYAVTLSCRRNLRVEMLHFGLSRTEVDTTA